MYPVKDEVSIIQEPEQNYHKGYIKAFRSIENHWISSNSYYFHAFIKMIMRVNYINDSTIIEGEFIECKRGQAIFSLDTWSDIFNYKLSKRWWTKQKVRTFFSLLVRDKMICTEGLRKTTRVTICNYDSYQNNQHGENTEKTRRKHSKNTEKTPSKERKEFKKEIYIPEFLEFKEYALSKKPNIDIEHLKLKYDAWVSNDWKNGNNKKILNWKSALNNTIPYIKESSQQVKSLLGY